MSGDELNDIIAKIEYKIDKGDNILYVYDAITISKSLEGKIKACHFSPFLYIYFRLPKITFSDYVEDIKIFFQSYWVIRKCNNCIIRLFKNIFLREREILVIDKIGKFQKEDIGLESKNWLNYHFPNNTIEVREIG